MKPTPNKRISSKSQRAQQHVLDVRIRAGKERERQVSAVFAYLAWTLAFSALAAGVWLGGKELWRCWVWENPDCLVHEPAVRTDGTLTREQILTTANIVEGRNILTVHLGAAQAALEKLPQVESAEVQRSFFPSRVAVTITERRPIAWVTSKKNEDPTTSERAFLIDARSVVLRSRVLLPEYLYLPVISGVETENLVPGQRVNAHDMLAALELVRLNADNTRFQTRHIDLAKGWCLVVTDQRRAEFTFGFDKIDEQLARLNQLLDALEPTHREIHQINIMLTRNVTVKFREPETETPAPPAATPPPAPESRPPKAATPPEKPGRVPPKTAPPRKGSRPTPPPVKPAPTPGVRKPFNLNE